MATVVQMRKQHIFTHNRIYGKGVLDLGLFSLFFFFPKNIIVFLQISVMSHRMLYCKMEIEMCHGKIYMLLLLQCID